jgi:hypothetical protein
LLLLSYFELPFGEKLTLLQGTGRSTSKGWV